MATREQQKRQMREDGPYFCGICFLGFPISGPDSHCSMSHKRANVECLACGTAFSGFSVMNDHVHDAHIQNFAEIQCRLCDYEFNGDVQRFISHMNAHYNGQI